MSEANQGTSPQCHQVKACYRATLHPARTHTYIPASLPKTHRQEAGIVSLAILCDITPDREAGGAEWLFTLHDGVAPGHRHIVHHPLVHVALVNTISEKFHRFPVCFFLCRVGLSAEHLRGRDILHETDLWQGRRESWWRKTLSNRRQSSHYMLTPSVSLQTPPAERELVHEVGGGGGQRASY